MTREYIQDIKEVVNLRHKIISLIAAISGIFISVYVITIFNKLLEIKNSRWFAIILSSILFGLFHNFNGSLIQVFITGFIVLVFCIFREKIKDCSLLSLVICHGLYDGLITLLVAYL